MAVDLFLGSPKSINIMIPFFLFKTWLSEKKKKCDELGELKNIKPIMKNIKRNKLVYN